MENDYAREMRIIENIVCAIKKSNAMDTRKEYIEALDFLFDRYRLTKAMVAAGMRCEGEEDK